MEITFRDIVKLIHPDSNPNIKDASTKMTEAVKNKNNPSILYDLGVRWGVIVPAIRTIINLVIGDMVSFTRPNIDGVEFGTIVDIEPFNNIFTGESAYRLKIYTVNGRCLAVKVATTEDNKHGIKFVRKVGIIETVNLRRLFNEKSAPVRPEPVRPEPVRPEPVRPEPTYTSTRTYSTASRQDRVRLNPNTNYANENINIYTKYGVRTATRTTAKRVYFEVNGKETFKNFNSDTYAWRVI